MRSFVPSLATMLIIASGCAFSHEAPVDAGFEDTVVDDMVAPDVFLRDVVIVPDVVTPPDVACASGTTRCPAAGCVDTTSDNANCGACGRACAVPANGGAMCVGGSCVSTCSSGYELCGSACVVDNVMHCGPACTPCAAVPNASIGCTAGACTHSCNAGFVDNGGACVSTTPPGCGNRMLEATEGCDDGNNDPGDGCSASCQMETGTQTENCSSVPVPIVISDTGAHFYRGSTTSAVNDVNGCSANGPDVAFLIRYALTVPYNFTVTARPSSTWDIVIQHDAVCPTAACVDVGNAGAAETYSIGETGPIDSDLMIDGYHSYDRGDFVIQIDIR